MEVRLRHLDVVAKDPVVADLERLDAGPLPFLLLELRDPVLPSRREVPEFVEFSVEPLPDHTPGLCEGRGIVHDRPPDEVDDPGMVAHRIEGFPDEERGVIAEERFYVRDTLKRLFQRRKVPGTGVPVGDPPCNPLDV